MPSKNLRSKILLQIHNNVLLFLVYFVEQGVLFSLNFRSNLSLFKALSSYSEHIVCDNSDNDLSGLDPS